MEVDLLHVTFSFEPGQGSYQNDERFAFWASSQTQDWFKARGYKLYERIWEGSSMTESSMPTMPSQVECGEAVYPYPHFDTDSAEHPEDPQMPLRARERTGKVGYAQDSLGRHVAIKIVHAGTNEYRILRFLHEQRLETLKENSIIPVLELIPNERFWFAVMPRWSLPIDEPEPKYLHEAITIIHSLLKGLNYLHEQNIVHGDIGNGNLLVNHISDEYLHLPKRGHLRAKKCLLYALFDFDLSILAPPDVDKKDFRLPASRSYGSYNVSNDTSAGEYDYNPFILDVGSMGVLLCKKYQHITDRLPLLAPLLDMMTCRDLNRRFTASEALRFFEDRVADLSEVEIAAAIAPTKAIDVWLKYEDCDRWENLPPEFVERWKAYRATPLTWHTKFLRRLCQTEFGEYIVPKIRYFMFNILSIPCRLYRWLVPGKIAL